MQNNKKVIEHCPNFYKIINFEYYEDDFITSKLIFVYQDYIFSIDVNDDESLSKASKIDKALSKYIDDYYFRKQMKKELTNLRIKKNENVFEIIVNSIISIFNKYEEGETRQIYVSRWI